MEVAVVVDTLRAFVLDNFLYGRPAGELDNDASFLETGIMDSTGIMELIAFLEEEFHVAVHDNELVPENLDSVNRVAAMLARKGITDSV